jgi:hypothetical protein
MFKKGTFMTVLRQSCAVFCANLGICDFRINYKNLRICNLRLAHLRNLADLLD